MNRFEWLASGIGVVLIGFVIVLFVQLDMTRTKLNEAIEANKVQTTSSIDSLQKTIDGLRSDAKTLHSADEATAKDFEGLKEDVAQLKAELAKSVSNSLTKAVVAAATEQAITQAVQEFMRDDNDFLTRLAKVLATGYQSALTGPSGKDADSERVAAFLMARPEFLDAVSVSLLDLQKP